MDSLLWHFPARAHIRRRCEPGRFAVRPPPGPRAVPGSQQPRARRNVPSHSNIPLSSALNGSVHRRSAVGWIRCFGIFRRPLTFDAAANRDGSRSARPPGPRAVPGSQQPRARRNVPFHSNIPLSSALSAWALVTLLHSRPQPHACLFVLISGFDLSEPPRPVPSSLSGFLSLSARRNSATEGSARLCQAKHQSNRRDRDRRKESRIAR